MALFVFYNFKKALYLAIFQKFFEGNVPFTLLRIIEVFPSKCSGVMHLIYKKEKKRKKNKKVEAYFKLLKHGIIAIEILKMFEE